MDKCQDNTLIISPETREVITTNEVGIAVVSGAKLAGRLLRAGVYDEKAKKESLGRQGVGRGLRRRENSSTYQRGIYEY